jgi:hypothetical protein
MKKFEGWITRELQDVASLIAGREMALNLNTAELYDQIIKEIRNRRIKEELYQMKLECKPLCEDCHDDSTIEEE